MEPYLDIGLGLTISYFFILLVLFPIANFFDRFIYDVYLYSDLKKNNKDDFKYYYDIEFTTSKISSKKKF